MIINCFLHAATGVTSRYLKSSNRSECSTDMWSRLFLGLRTSRHSKFRFKLDVSLKSSGPRHVGCHFCWTCALSTWLVFLNTEGLFPPSINLHSTTQPRWISQCHKQWKRLYTSQWPRLKHASVSAVAAAVLSYEVIVESLDIPSYSSICYEAIIISMLSRPWRFLFQWCKKKLYTCPRWGKSLLIWDSGMSKLVVSFFARKKYIKVEEVMLWTFSKMKRAVEHSILAGKNDFRFESCM